MAAEADDTDFWGTTAGEMQADLTVGTDAITGTLHYIDSGALAHDWGAGNFMALKFTDIDKDATSIKVGMQPSASSGLVEIINDPDKNGVFKVTDKAKQKFVVQTTVDGKTTTKHFSLTGLTVEEA